MESLGQRLTRYREYNNLTEMQLSESLDISQSYYNNIIHGRKVPGKTTLTRILDVLEPWESEFSVSMEKKIEEAKSTVVNVAEELPEPEDSGVIIGKTEEIAAVVSKKPEAVKIEERPKPAEKKAPKVEVKAPKVEEKAKTKHYLRSKVSF